MVDGLSADYSRLASAELDAAGGSLQGENKLFHLNRAAMFAFLSDSQTQGLAQLTDMTAISAVLLAAMAVADAVDASMAAIHINSALVEISKYTPAP